jgi:hypothetical protein
MKRKLQLHRETVRNLEGRDLSQAQGGILTTTPGCPRLTATCFCPPVTLIYTQCESNKPTCLC